MTKQVYYLCNPEKNKTCRKTNCKHNPHSISKTCKFTSRIEYALDKTPVVMAPSEGRNK